LVKQASTGLRDHASYYAAFLRDPDGNRIEAVCHHALRLDRPEKPKSAA
jgi:hypothetical protein